MAVFADSVLYRGARLIGLWLSRAAGDSLIGRFFVGMSRSLGRAAAVSPVFGTERTGSSRLEDGAQPVSVRALSRPYLWLRRRLAGGALGRALGVGRVNGRRSQLSGGGWVRLVGAGLAGLGCGRAIFAATGEAGTAGQTAAQSGVSQGQAVMAALLVLAGILLLSAGRRLVVAFGDSLVGRGFGKAIALPSRDLSTDTSGSGIPAVTWVSVVLCAAAGVVAGMTSAAGPTMLVAFVLAVCAVVLALRRPELILVVLAVFPWADWAVRSTMGGLGPLWDDALLVVSILLLLWCTLVLGRGSLRTVPITVPFLCALAAAVGSVVINKVPGDVAMYGLRVMFEPLLFFFVGFLFPKTGRWVRWVVALFLLSVVALALHGIYQYATDAPMLGSWVDPSEIGIGTRAYSVVTNPNVLGALLSMGLLISLGLALSSGLRGLWRLTGGLVAIIELVGLAVTFSRGAWLGSVLGIVAMLILAYRRYLVPAAAVGVVAWFAAPRALVERLLFAFGSTYIARSQANGRLYRWETSLGHIVAHPWFGVGFGTFGGTSAYMFDYWAIWTDNYYLQIAAEGGLLLLVFYLWMLLRVGKGLVKGHRTTRDPFLRALTAGVFGAVVAVAAANFFAPDWETLTLGVSFWFLVGLVISAALPETARDPAEVTPGPSEQERAD
jgi:O-antigen ligase